MNRNTPERDPATPSLPLSGLPPDLKNAAEDDEDLEENLPERVTVNKSNDLTTDYEFFVPVHGFVRFSDEELEIINHPAFQRLGEIYQLGQVYLVYRGATHKRLEHVLGVVHVAQQMINAVADNHARLARKKAHPSNCELSSPFSKSERAFIRLAALLHDIGHVASGHTLEDELDLWPKHDERARIELVLNRESWPSGKCEPLRAVVDRNYTKFLDGATVSPAELAICVICKKEKLPPGKCGKLRLQVCRDVVGNTICADLLDYLHRDWWHIGKPRFYERRLFQYMEIRERPMGGPQFVISLGSSDRLKTDAVSLIVDLLESRYQLAESVLFHRTKCSASAMLERVVQEVYDAIKDDDRDKWVKRLEIQLLDCSDSGLLNLLAEEAAKCGADAAIKIINDLRCRRIFRQAYTFPFGKKPIVGRRLQDTYAEVIGANEQKDRKAARKRRLDMVRGLEMDFGLPSGSVAIYCPTKGMNAKIAQVNLHIEGQIAPFEDWAPSDPSLGSDHLKAQKARFERLWRVHVCVSREVWDKFSVAEKELFRAVTKYLALGITNSPYYEVAQRLARQALASDSTLFSGRSFKAAANEKNMSLYPTKAPCISNFLVADKDGGK